MTIRNLNAVFEPASVAIVGATDRSRAVGAVVLQNVLAGGFRGPIMPVNPKHTALSGLKCYDKVDSLPMAPDVAVICTPPRTVPGLIAELGARGTRGAVVITAGLRETADDRGRTLEQQMLDAARPHLLRIVGPNCIGVISAAVSLNASFAPSRALSGHVAFVAQSGAVLSTVLDWAQQRCVGFSHLVSLGDMADVDFGDMLDYLAGDTGTAAIVLYIEGVTHARKFISAARAASRLKPVVAIKAGRAPQGARAAASHTGALAGIDAVYDAAFRRTGVLRVHDLDEVFDAVETLSVKPNVPGDRLTILTNGGGVGVLATDALIEQGGRLAVLEPDTVARLDKVLPSTWSRANPVDIIGDADGNRYAAALTILESDKSADAILALHCPTAIASGLEAAKSLVTAKSPDTISLLTSWLGSGEAEAARRLFASSRIATYDTPEKAVRGFMHLVRYKRAQDQLMEVPSAASDFAPDRAHARELLDSAADGWLAPQSVQKLFENYGIPVARSSFAGTPSEVMHASARLGGSVTVKIVSRDITHKSDVGGVALDLPSPSAARDAAENMLRRIRATRPQARIDGFLVQQMIERPMAIELILGMAVDETFGPFLLFGHGGVAVEQIADRALALPPLNTALACELISQTRVWRLIQGFRGRPPANVGQIAEMLVRLSMLVCDCERIVELDINPLLADADGVIAVDARVRLGKRATGLSISPYPVELSRLEQIAGVGTCVLRPVRPEDAPAFETFFVSLSPEDQVMRAPSPLRAPPPGFLARMTQIDYDREMALVLFHGGDVLGTSRISADPDHVNAEISVTIRSDMRGRGLDRLLLERIIGYARSRRLTRLIGDIPEGSGGLTALCRELGFELEPLGRGVVRAKLSLMHT